jgi:hypothetical protein
MNWRPQNADALIENFVTHWFKDRELRQIGLSCDATVAEIHQVAAEQLQAAVDHCNDLQTRDYLSTFIDYLTTWVRVEHRRRVTTSALGRIARELMALSEAFSDEFDTDNFDDVRNAAIGLDSLSEASRNVIEKLEDLTLYPKHAWDPEAAAKEEDQ